MFKITLERNKCTSCGTCEDLCPEHFELAEDAFAHIKGSKKAEVEELELEDEDCFMDAAENCPAMCIHVYKDGKEVL